MKTEFNNNWSAGDLDQNSSKEIPLRWVCKDLIHNGFNFAKELYINKVIITKKDGSVKELKKADFASFGVDDILDASDNVKDEYKNIFQSGSSRSGDLLNIMRTPNGDKYSYNVYFNRHNFNSYGVGGTAMGFKSKPSATASPIFIFTSLSFAPYGVNPPHEFSGGLNATRMMPSIWFATEDESIASIRFDYRFHLHTDDNFGFPLLFSSKEVNFPIKTTQNFASIIRDDDHLVIFSCFNKLLTAIDSYLKNRVLLSVQYAELLVLWAEVFFANKFYLLPKLIKLVGDISITIASLVSNLGTIIYELALGIRLCLAEDILKSMSDAFEIFKAEADRLEKALMPVLNDLAGLISTIFKLISTLTVDALDEAGTIIGEVIVPVLAPIFRRNRLQRQAATRKTVADLLVEYDKLKVAFKADLSTLVDQVVFTVGKIFTYIAFEAAEKPVAYEMVGYFANKGQVDKTWDNLHWWGTNYLPSAPGAFHAIHQHFRWARYLGNPSLTETLGNKILFYLLGGGADPVSDPEKTAPFRSLVSAFKDSDIGGPLIDPGLPNQTIEFAVALNGGDLDQALLTISKTKSFVEVAKSLSSAAKTAERLEDKGNQDRYTGSDIVYWLSLKAEREDFKKPFEGTLLINGFYFAHDREPAASLLGDTHTNFAAMTKGTSAHRPAYTNPVKLFREPK